jgi:PleD family two-component response regulator
MIRQALDSKITEVVNDRDEQSGKSGDRTKVLIVDGNAVVRQELARLINSEADLRVCVNAGNANQDLRAVQSQPVDLAIVGNGLSRMYYCA